MASSAKNRKTGLVLTGGGARAAYQVGVLKSVCKFLPVNQNPFHIISGTSAGAINAATLAINAADFQRGVRRLNMVWRNFEVHQVFRADTLGLIRTGIHWMAALSFGGIGKFNPKALLDRTPLFRLLHEHLDFSQIQQAIDNGDLDALSITASGYDSGQSVSFFQGLPELKHWHRVRRLGVPAEIGIEHLMASSAIPFLFQAEHINREYFGDGSMRQTAPLSAALHLGSDRLLVIGVNNDRSPDERKKITSYPSLAKIAGNVLNSIFLDSLDSDIERLHRINQTLQQASKGRLTRPKIGLRHVDTLIISPSEDIGAIASKYIHRLPRPLRLLLRGVGAINHDDSSFVSYLMFDRTFCRELISLGYADAMQNKDELKGFLESQARD